MSTRVARLNEQELRLGIAGQLEASWHNDYKDTAWVFIGSLPTKLSEGDVICVVSQFGEVEDLNLIRDADTGQSKGTAYVKFRDWRSTVLAVDNLDGVKLLGQLLKCDHARYERPKKKWHEEALLSLEDKARAQQPGHAYGDPSKIEIEGDYSINQGPNLFAPIPEKDEQGPKPSAGMLKKKEQKKHKREKRPEKRGKSGKEKKTKSNKRGRESAADEGPSQQASQSRHSETEVEKRRRIAALSAQPAVSWKG